jgi:hypothetical protein
VNSCIENEYASTLEWLLEHDYDQPGVRYLTLRDLVGLGEADIELADARKAAMDSGPVAQILNAQSEEGYWVRPGPGYSPKYTGTVWQIIFMGQLGASGDDDRVRKGCEYLLTHTCDSTGAVSMTGAPSGFIHCLSGNLIAALIDLGYGHDERVLRATEIQARLVLGRLQSEDGVPGLRYYNSGTSDSLYACAHNLHHPCAWGAVKALLAFGKLCRSVRSQSVKDAVEQTTSFLLEFDPAKAEYPSVYGDTPSANWFKFGYPLGYMGDVLQNIEALAGVGCAQDPRLANALRLIESKKGATGRWVEEYKYRSKLWPQVELVGRPSKWITLRALRVLDAAYGG